MFQTRIGVCKSLWETNRGSCCSVSIVPSYHTPTACPTPYRFQYVQLAYHVRYYPLGRPNRSLQLAREFLLVQCNSDCFIPSVTSFLDSISAASPPSTWSSRSIPRRICSQGSWWLVNRFRWGRVSLKDGGKNPWSRSLRRN